MTASTISGAEPSGGLVVFCTDAGVTRYDPAAVKGRPQGIPHYFAREGIGLAPRVSAAAQTRDGRMWFGSWDGAICRLDGEHSLASHQPESLASLDRPGDTFGLSGMTATAEGFSGSGPTGVVPLDGRLIRQRDAFGRRIDANHPVVARTFLCGSDAKGENSGVATTENKAALTKDSSHLHR